MSSTAPADAAATEHPDHLPEPVNNEPDVMESKPDLPAQTVADEDNNETAPAQKDDPATMAASEELKHTRISEKSSAVELASTEVEPVGGDKPMEERAVTPEGEYTEVQDEEMRERLSSPKKKRGRDQVEDTKESEGNNEEAGATADGSVLNGNRTIRSGPEKKRPRDTSEEASKSEGKPVVAKVR